MSDKKDNRMVVEILTLVAAAGAAALMIRHETGPSAFLKTRKQVLAATAVAAVIAAIAMTKAVTDLSKKGTKFSVLAYLSGAVVVAGLLVSAKRTDTTPKYLASGATGPDVLKAQLGLLKLGYSFVTPTGKMDSPTTEALKRFQAAYSLVTQDGSLTPETSALIDQIVAQLHLLPLSPDAGYQPPLTT